MATTLFPTTTVRAATSTFSSATTRDLAFSRGGGSTTQTDNTVASLSTVSTLNASGGTAAPWGKASATTLNSATGAVESGATVGASLFFLSGPITGFTLSGNITVNARASESAAQANYAIGCKLYQISGNAVIAVIGGTANTTELGTSDAATSLIVGPTSTVFADGDQIGLLLYYGSPTGSTSASGKTAAGTYNGASSGAAGDTFATFTETITAFSPAISLPFPQQSVPFYPRPSRPS